MPEDRSLDEFAAEAADDADVADDANSDADVDTAPDATAPADGDDTVDGPEMSPAEATLDHTPDGASCAVCGETVTRRWRDDAGYVCPECKEW